LFAGYGKRVSIASSSPQPGNWQQRKDSADFGVHHRHPRPSSLESSIEGGPVANEEVAHLRFARIVEGLDEELPGFFVELASQRPTIFWLFSDRPAVAVVEVQAVASVKRIETVGEVARVGSQD
jgi:hypothetical protein